MAIVPDSEHHPHFGELPQSAGFPPAVVWGGVVGVIMIFVMGFLSFYLSSYGHMWPAEKTQREPLSPGTTPANGEVPNGK